MDFDFMPILKSGSCYSFNGYHPTIRIDGSEACTRYWHHQKDYFDAEDFPGIAPPSEVCAVEVSDPPSSIVANGIFEKWYEHVDSYAVVYEFQAFHKEADPGLWRDNISRKINDLSVATQPTKHQEIQRSLLIKFSECSDEQLSEVVNHSMEALGNSQAAWELVEVLYIRKFREIYPVISRRRFLDKQGFIIGKAIGGIIGPDRNPLVEAAEEMGGDGFIQAFIPFLDSCLEVLGFISCKNISLTEQAEKISRQQRRARARSGQLADFRYHVLSISSPSGVKSRIGVTSDSQPLTSLHVCRGHFKRYTHDAPLFGRLTGTFYIPQHTRGRAENGSILKDYKVVKEHV